MTKEQKVEELVEWVAERCWLSHINHALLSNPRIPPMEASDFRKQKLINHSMFTDLAKQILSNTKFPLVLIDRDAWPLRENTLLVPVIPLADLKDK